MLWKLSKPAVFRILFNMFYTSKERKNLAFQRHIAKIGHPSVEEDLSLKIEVRDQTIWTSTPEL